MIEGQLTFDEFVKQQQYNYYLNILENMQQDEIKNFKTADCDVTIKAIGETVYSPNSFQYKLSNNEYGYYYSIKDLAAHIVIGFLADKYECKWIDGFPVAWIPMHERH